MIATFPDFSKLTLSLKDDIEFFTRQFPPYSDFNFTSLYSWNTDGTTEVSKLNDNLIIRLPDYTTGELFYSLLGTTDVKKTINELSSLTNKLYMVPHSTISEIEEPSGWLIEPDRDNYDYIYRVRDLAELSGGSYKKKRNKAHAVQKRLGENLFVSQTKILSLQSAEEIKQIHSSWLLKKGEAVRDYDAENIAINRLLAHADRFNLTVTILSYQSTPCGFSINETLDKKYAICHFEKVTALHPNLNTFLVNEVAKYHEQLGIEFFNWEQDLGILNLRQSKDTFNPITYLRKYTVTIK